MFERFKRTKATEYPVAKASIPQIAEFFKKDDLREEPNWLEDAKSVPTPARAKAKARKRQTSRAESKQAVVNYLNARKSATMTYEEIAQAVGTTSGYISALVTELISSGTIVRRGKRGQWKFTVNHNRVNKKRSTSAKAVVKELQLTKTPSKVMEKPVGRPRPAQDKVYDYLIRNEDKLLTQEEIARCTGTAISKISKQLKQLVDQGRVVRSLPTRSGTRYWMAKDGLPTPGFATEKTAPERLTASTNEVSLASALEKLATEFMLSTYSTNLVEFIGWLKKK